MNRTVIGVVTVLACAAALRAQGGAAEGEVPKPKIVDERGVREAVMNYFEGVCETDRDKLEKAWDVQAGHMKHIKEQAGTETVSIVSANLALEWWTRSRAKESYHKFHYVDIVDDKMAFVKFEFHFNTLKYMDYLTLYRLNGEWKIVNKSFVKM